MINRLTGLGLAALLGVSVTVAAAFIASAAPNVGNEPGTHLVIREVQIDFTLGAEIIFIRVDNFDLASADDLVVRLGDIGDISGQCGIVPDPAVIVACDFSTDGLPGDGDYLLTVATSSGNSESATYDLTIGAVGPEGPQGPAGEKGDPAALGFYARTTGPTTLGTETTTGSATCDSGDSATGGGYRLVDELGNPPADNPAFVSSSEPNPPGSVNPDGWLVRAFAAGVSPLVSLYVSVMCAVLDTSIPTIPS